MSNSIYKGKL